MTDGKKNRNKVVLKNFDNNILLQRERKRERSLFWNWDISGICGSCTGKYGCPGRMCQQSRR